jgi:hypothetical protein
MSAPMTAGRHTGLTSVAHLDLPRELAQEWARGLVQAANVHKQSLHWDFPDYIRERIEQLRGKDLVCWCALNNPCHADVLLELANQ